jgi:hypothetical protein
MKAAAAAEMRAQRNRVTVNQPKEQPPEHLREERAAFLPAHANRLAHFSRHTDNGTCRGRGICYACRIREARAGRGCAERRPRRRAWPRTRLCARTRAKKKMEFTDSPTPPFPPNSRKLPDSTQPLAAWKSLRLHQKRSIFFVPSRGGDAAHRVRISWPSGCGSRARTFSDGVKVGKCASLSHSFM